VNLKEQEKDVEIMHNNDKSEIYVHALTCLSTPQTLNIAWYIKKQNVIIHIELGSTHNFIGKRLPESLNFFVYPLTNFHALVPNGVSIDCVVKFHSIQLSM
jgi:hypothetical protein